jgi:hypothetical protein
MSDWEITNIEFHDDKYIFDNNDEDIFTLYDKNNDEIEEKIYKEVKPIKLSISTTSQEQLSPQIPPTPSPTPNISPLLKPISLEEISNKDKSYQIEKSLSKYPLVNEILVSNINKKIIRKKEKSKKYKKDKKDRKQRRTKKILLYGKNKRIIRSKNN